MDYFGLSFLKKLKNEGESKIFIKTIHISRKKRNFTSCMKKFN